ncbi:polysaccharide deacetylase family protein [Candidatus Saccharibacteria bacterium]|nr:polysaccharide deacetylase family protein [Candidatus Saccharibacteria bacterium]
MTNQFSFPTIGRTVSFGFIIVSIAALNLVAWGAPALAASDDRAAQDSARALSEFRARQEPRLNVDAVPYADGQKAATPANTTDGIYHCGIGSTSSAAWLTFDDSGTTSQIRAILTQLRKYNVRALFFPTGQFAYDRPDLITLIKNDGHYVGNHSYSHADLMTLSSSSIRSEISRADTVIKPSPSNRKFFRAPYGSGSFSTMLNSILTEYSYQNCFWTVDTRDWSGSSAATIVNRVKYGDSYTPALGKRGIVLLHMHGAHTAESIPGIMEVVKKYGYPKLNP